MITKTCTQCKKKFVLNDGEIAFYKKKKLHLPNRCKECRDANKLKNGKEANRVPAGKELDLVSEKTDNSESIVKVSSDYMQELLHTDQKNNREDMELIATAEETNLTPVELKAKRRKFILLVVAFIIFWIIGYVVVKTI